MTIQSDTMVMEEVQLWTAMEVVVVTEAMATVVVMEEVVLTGVVIVTTTTRTTELKRNLILVEHIVLTILPKMEGCLRTDRTRTTIVTIKGTDMEEDMEVMEDTEITTDRMVVVGEVVVMICTTEITPWAVVTAMEGEIMATECTIATITIVPTVTEEDLMAGVMDTVTDLTTTVDTEGGTLTMAEEEEEEDTTIKG